MKTKLLSLFIMIFAFTPSVNAQTPLSKIVAATKGSAGEKNVEILASETAYIDSSIDVGTLTINGKLSCGNNAEIKAKTIYVNGTFECGSASKPFTGKLFISLKHSATDPRKTSAYRGLVVNSPGKLLLFGSNKRAGYYKLVQNAQAGHTSVKISGNVSGAWQVGDEVVIASSSYNPWEAESLKVTRIETGQQSVVYFDRRLYFNHWGSTETFKTQRGNIVLDERAEVANLNRNIVIRPDETTPISDANIPGGMWGGHVMVNKGGYANVDSVEFYRMGQAGVMARYPFHWHRADDVKGQFIKNSSIHRSFQRCITVHQTNKALVENNVCYYFRGHGFFLEDGNEVDNVITKNLGILAITVHQGTQTEDEKKNNIMARDSRALLASDVTNGNISGATGKRFPAVSVFWISNPKNTVTNNIAAGSLGTGFWNAFVDVVREFDYSTGEYKEAQPSDPRPLTTDTTAFSNNVAHSTLVGITWDGAPIEDPKYSIKMNNPNNERDRKLNMAHYAPKTTPVYSGLVTYKNLHTGIYFRGQSAVFDNSIMADNGWAYFLAANQVVKNSLVVGKSSNHSTVDDAYLYGGDKPRYKERQVGVVLYDGPFELSVVDFRNYSEKKVTYRFPGSTDARDITPAPFATIGGNDKYYNLSEKVSFSPEPYYRVFMDFLDYGEGNGWMDEILANNIRDLDGTLTGTVGGFLAPQSQFTSNSKCSAKSINKNPSFEGFVLCPPDFQVSTIWMASENTGTRTPFVMKRSDWKFSLDKKKWDWLDVIGKIGSTPQVNQLKMMLINDQNYTYELMLAPHSILTGEGYRNIFMRMYAPAVGTAIPVTKIINAGSNCEVLYTDRHQDLNSLQNATKDGFYSNGNDLYVKYFTTAYPSQNQPGPQVKSKMGMGDYKYVRCKDPVIPAVKGMIDTVTLVNGVAEIKGWACDFSINKSIDVHLYAGGAAGNKGVMIGKATANIFSETGVNFICGDATKTDHRFTIKVSGANLRAYAGQKLYVHGISASGRENSTITNSGAFDLPSDGSKPYGDIIGNFESLTSNGLLKGWSCESNNPSSVKVEVYAGDPSSGGKLITSATAAEASESGVLNACGTKNAKHRFSIQLTDAQINLAQDKQIFVLGVPQTSGRSKLKINNSGNLTMPRAYIEGWTQEAVTENGKKYILGWACDVGRSKQIGLHIFAGGPHGIGTRVGEATANVVAESGVAVACKDPAKLHHRFKWEIPSSVLSAHKGKQVFIHGLSVTGNENSILKRQGNPVIP